MPHETSLIALVALGLVFAFAFGFAASKLRLPPLVGYLLAGIAMGPFTPGFVADAAIASQLAEIGVMLLMFGVGLHYDVGDLWQVRRVAIPGAVVQMAVVAAMGYGLGRAWGLSPAGAWIFGIAAAPVVGLAAITIWNGRATKLRPALPEPGTAFERFTRFWVDIRIPV